MATYKARYLIDETDSSADPPVLSDSEGNITLTANVATLPRVRENDSDAYLGNGPYKLGQEGNPTSDGGKYSLKLNGASNTKIYNSTQGTSFDSWSGNFSISMWIRLDDHPEGDREMIFSSINGTPSGVNGFYISYNDTSNTIDIGYYDSISYVNKLNISNINTTLWYFIVITYDGSTLKAYCGNNNNTGIATDFPSLSASEISFTSTLTFEEYVIGRNVSEDDQYTGCIDNIRIFSGVITSTEIMNIYKYNSRYLATGTTNIAGSYGDVHIKTLDGLHYDLHDIGYHRWFSDGDKFIINTSIQYGRLKRWKKKDYVNEIFIKNGDDYIHIDPGFRGTKCKVIKAKNEDGSITWKIKDKEFSKDAKNHCSECLYPTLTDLKNKNCMTVETHSKTRGHPILDMVRNTIIVNVKTSTNKYEIIISNINELNLQPALIDVIPENYDNCSLWEGCIVHSDKNYMIKDIYTS